MADRPPDGPTRDPASWKQQKVDFGAQALEQALAFMRTDNRITNDVAAIVGSLAKYVEANPERVFARIAPGVGAIGADEIAGGQIDELIGFIGDLITGEKEFFTQLIGNIINGIFD